MKALCMKIGSEYYALNGESVLEIIRLPMVVPVPEIDLPVKGIFLYRNQVVPLLDVQKILAAINGDENEGNTKVVIIKGPEGIFGIDCNIEGVFEFETMPMELPEGIPEQRRIFLKGILRMEDNVYGLLNIGAFVLENLKTPEV